MAVMKDYKTAHAKRPMVTKNPKLGLFFLNSNSPHEQAPSLTHAYGPSRVSN